MHLRNQYHSLKSIKRKESKPAKSKLNKEELCSKAEASACTPKESILLSEEDNDKERKPYKFNLNKEELCCKEKASDLAPEEPISLAKEDKREKKETF